MYNRWLNCGFRFLKRKQCSSWDMKEQVSLTWSWNRRAFQAKRTACVTATRRTCVYRIWGPQKNPVSQRKVNGLKTRAWWTREHAGNFKGMLVFEFTKQLEIIKSKFLWRRDMAKFFSSNDDSCNCVFEALQAKNYGERIWTNRFLPSKFHLCLSPVFTWVISLLEPNSHV